MKVQRSLTLLLCALVLAAPVATVSAQGPGDGGQPDNAGSGYPGGADGNDTANMTAGDGNATAGDGNATVEDGNATGPDGNGTADGSRAPVDDERRRQRDRADAVPDDAREARERGLHTRGPMTWSETNGTVTGPRATFNVTQYGITDYDLIGSVLPVLDAVTLDADENATWAIRGATFSLGAGDAWIRAIATPHAVLMVHAGNNTTATIDVADGVVVDDLTRGNGTGRALYQLTLSNNWTMLLGGNLSDDGNGTFTVNGGAAQLRLAAPVHGGDEAPGAARAAQARSTAVELRNEHRAAIAQALVDGTVGVEVHTANGTEPVAVALGHVRVRGASVGHGASRATLAIEAPDGAPGTVVFLNIDPAQLGNLTLEEAAEQLAVLYDNATIVAADDVADILDWRNDDGPEYLLLVGADGVQVLVSVPHFSPHTLEVTQSGSSDADGTGDGGADGSDAGGDAGTVDETPLPALVVPAALVVATALAAFVARRDE